MLDDLALFVAIVEGGSLNAAARRENLPAATVTRRLQKLEKRLGCRLLERSARRMVPTPEGMQYYEQCRPLIRGLGQITRSLDDAMHAMAGPLRVLAPEGLAIGALAPAWSSFLETHPGITLQLELSNAMQDLIGTGADLAIRVGRQRDSALTQRRLGTLEIGLVASPGYLSAHPLADGAPLDHHRVLVAEPLDPTRLPSPEQPLLREATAVRMRVNNMTLAIQLAESGLGLLLCPLHQCAAALEQGRLVRVASSTPLPFREVYAVWSQHHYLPARVRALVEHLAELFARHPMLG